MIAIPNSVLVNSCVNADPVSEHFSGSKTKSICTLYKALADVTYVNRYCVRKRYSVYTCIKRTVETKKSKRVSIEKPKKSCFVTMPSLRRKVDFDDAALRAAREHEHRNPPQ